jgi:hypothetical protein
MMQLLSWACKPDALMSMRWIAHQDRGNFYFSFHDAAIVMSLQILTLLVSTRWIALALAHHICGLIYNIVLCIPQQALLSTSVLHLLSVEHAYTACLEILKTLPS